MAKALWICYFGTALICQWLFYHFPKIPIWQVFEICYCWRSFYFSCAFCLLECKSGVYQTDNIDNSAEGIFNK